MSQGKERYWSQGFNVFRNALIEDFACDDIEVIRSFSPFASRICNTDLSGLHKQSVACETDIETGSEVNLETAKRKSNARIGIAVMPEMSFDKNMQTAKEVLSDISQTLLSRLAQLEKLERIYRGLTEEEIKIIVLEKSIRESEVDTRKIENKIKALSVNGGDADRAKSLRDYAKRKMAWSQEQRRKIADLEDKIAKGQAKRLHTSYYVTYTDCIILLPTNTAEDVITLVHEAGHASTRKYLRKEGSKSLLDEIPPILAEVLADRKLTRAGIGNEHRAVGRAVDLQYDAELILLLNKIFSEYEQKGTVSHKVVDSAFYDSAEIERHKKPWEYAVSDVVHFSNMMTRAKYFIGTVGALSSIGDVRDKKDFDEIVACFNDTRLTNSRRLSVLGITQKIAPKTTNTLLTQK